MDHRKEMDTQNRLYLHGVDKQRKILEDDHNKKIEGIMHSKMNPNALKGEPKDGHRGLPSGVALYAHGQEQNKKKLEKI